MDRTSPTMSIEFSHEAVYLCPHVFKNERPVLLVVNDNYEWQFLCGFDHSDEEGPIVVGLSHIINMDPSLKEVMIMPENHEAERDRIGGKWEIKTI